MIKVFSIETNNVKRWFLKKPVRYLEDINYILGVEFEDGEICDYTIWTKYLHREDGPATEYPNGDKEWYLNGKLHREDGPAIDGEKHKYWYWHGEFVDVKSQEEFEIWKRFKNFQ